MPKIVSIGNISLGGTGKTPFTIFLANKLISKGYNVAILSRGYKGKIGYDTNLISDDKKILLKPPLAADEPYMIAVNCKGVIVITGKDRNKSYQFLLKNFKNIDFVLLDDAFQHRKMKRDLDILLLDHKNPISTGLPFPFGYLREFPSAIKRADIIIFTRANSFTIPANVKKYIKDKPTFFSKTKPVGVFYQNNLYDLEFLKDKNVVAFAGIAKNRNFFKLLESLGANLVYTKGFMDHHLYKEREISFLLKIKERYKADLLITTEKDFVKMDENLKNLVSYLKIGIEVNEENRLIEMIEKEGGNPLD
ncbi:tetraacyldisaccharide 4'-kinase [Deferribacter thermophilus]|uniref:tetraacyldisaccharide 4'-kinase n=1 Tax=Deferribacter thermophilus TaxID=53573 RepID=UPI003C27168D